MVAIVCHSLSHPAVACDGPEYELTTIYATILSFLWPVGVPLFFWLLIYRGRLGDQRSQGERSILSGAVSFLKTEYRDNWYCNYWELVEVGMPLHFRI